MNNLKVLVAPAGQVISDKVGSDPGVVYNLLKWLSGIFNVEFYGICNKLIVAEKLPYNVRIMETNLDLGGGTLEQMLFFIRYSKLARRLLKAVTVNLIHHMWPPAFGNTYNPVALSNKADGIPFVMGPALCNEPIPSQLAEELYLVKGGKTSWGDLRSPRQMVLEKILHKSVCLLKPAVELQFRRTLERADKIVVVNAYTERMYKKLVESKKIVIIPHGVDTKKFRYSPPPKGSDILFVGGLFFRKGLHFLIKALPKVIRDFPDVRLHVLGNGPQLTSFKKLAKELQVESKVRFYGFVSETEKIRFYRMCRILCLPTLHESFGIVLLEAMASGRPVITTNTIGPREIVCHGKTGILVPPADSETLAEAIMTLLSDYELTCKMAVRGREVAERKYDWRVIARQYYDVYQTVCK